MQNLGKGNLLFCDYCLKKKLRKIFEYKKRLEKVRFFGGENYHKVREAFSGSFRVKRLFHNLGHMNLSI